MAVTLPRWFTCCCCAVRCDACCPSSFHACSTLLPCAGMKVTYEWVETSGLLPQGAFNASKPNLVIKVRGGW